MSSRAGFACGGAALLVLAGCGPEVEDDGPESPLDEEQAEERVEEHITETATTALPESLELESFGGGVPSACGSNPDLVTVSKRYWLDGLPPEENEEHVEALHEYWSDNGYTVVDDQRPDDLSIYVRHDKDDFTMSLWSSVEGDLSLGASSPCIDPSGVDE
ncbi:hypothetical protein F4561_005932 [Lipingzhangella halophila]|uniref:Lipoprotein n=1 Tax=Lipingzhangella halophila TaxID=1783352 RepID=A0A7W7W5T1_9ACTN|nr:hypothetical protein [Lipingzhangella halophila]MBB4935038.1 hypothetical protein [Lipingzhangella halophila]